MPLHEAVDKLRKNFNLRIFVSERAFADAGRAGINDKTVSFPKVDNVALGDFIKQILSQAGGTFELVGDRLMVIPAGEKKPVPPVVPVPNPVPGPPPGGGEAPPPIP